MDEEDSIESSTLGRLIKFHKCLNKSRWRQTKKLYTHHRFAISVGKQTYTMRVLKNYEITLEEYLISHRFKKEDDQ